jgi:hypothetical protein
MSRSLILLIAVAACATAAGAPPPARGIPQDIDQHIRSQWKEQGVRPAPAADDATIVRRLTLDLVGRIPAASEVAAYLADKAPDRKVRLVDRLMASGGFQRHLVHELDALLAPESGRRVQGNLREYLTRAVKEGRPWDRVFRELILADEKEPGQKGAAQFLKARLKDHDRLTNDVSVLFFGVNISCAQCHDHPLVHDWKQDHYYGLKSFLARSYEQGPHIGERDVGSVSFKTTKNVTKTAKMMFLTGQVIDAPGSDVKADPKAKGGKKADPKAGPPEPPKWSARAALVDVALAPEGRKLLARAIVNRTWHRLLGQGLVTPVDQMHSENPPSHPELLDALSQRFIDEGYSLPRLIRAIVLSDTYALASRYEGEGWPPARSFGVARPRPLTPMQLALSLKVASAAPSELARVADVDSRAEAMEGSARGLANLFEHPRDDFQIGVSEALLFSNSGRIEKELLTDGKNTLLGALKDEKNLDRVADVAVLNVLGRPPSAEEKKAFVDYLASRRDRPAEALRQAIWALLASAEMRFNH